MQCLGECDKSLLEAEVMCSSFFQNKVEFDTVASLHLYVAISWNYELYRGPQN
jgi:hypothetical protein